MSTDVEGGGRPRTKDDNMTEELPRRVALGCIARYIDKPDPYMEFIRNAREHGHPVERLIISLTQTADLEVLAELNDVVPVELIEIGDSLDLPEELEAMGAAERDVAMVMDTSPLSDHGLVPFCAQRNAVLLKALLLDIDALIFFDQNMRPVELIAAPEEQTGRRFRDVDFVGVHLESLAMGAAVTTGSYSGFDAFPPHQMPNLRDLLHGIGREDTHRVIAAEGALAGLHLASDKELAPVPAQEAFAGNLGIDLCHASTLPPFFSGWFWLGDEIVLTRGEDTLLGAAATVAQIGCANVGTRVFLDPHGTYPDPPEVTRERMKDRLYWNCLGWIARLPLLDHVRFEAGLLDWSPDEMQAQRRVALQQGAADLSASLADNRFFDLPTFFDLCFMETAKTVASYEASRRAWRRLVHVLRPDQQPAPRRSSVVPAPLRRNS